MGFIAKDSGGGNFKPAPAGTHLARCYRMIDLGTQSGTFNGETKLRHKIQLTWELHGEDDDGNALVMDDGKPLIVNKRYTLSLHAKAGLRRDLESWRGKPFTEDEAKGFDVRVLLDKWCMLSLIHNKVGEKTYVNIAGISSVPSAMRKSLPTGVNKIAQFDLEDPDMEMFSTFHEKLQEAIKAAPEWSHTTYQKPGPEKQIEKATATAGGFDDMDDDIPY